MSVHAYSAPHVIAPTIDAVAALAELRLAYAWLMSPVKNGGLGYSAARAQQTHIFKAIVALGGSA